MAISYFFRPTQSPSSTEQCSAYLCTYPLHVRPLHVGVPYVSFNGTTLANHSYVDLNLVKTDGKSSVRCHTDLQTCCNKTQGADRGDWYFPNGTRLQFNGGGGDIYEYRYDRQVALRRMNNADTSGIYDRSGIYRCTIETNAVRSDGSDIATRETVYAGLYASGGECTHMCM